MAKSTRSKVKRSHRAKKRDDGVYAAVEAARLQRLNAKLRSVCEAPKLDNLETEEKGDAAMPDETLQEKQASTDSMDLDAAGAKSEGKVSTHGPRNSRREQWRASKGMTPRPKSRGMNRQGGVAAKQKSGRPQRRR